MLGKLVVHMLGVDVEICTKNISSLGAKLILN